MTHAKKVIVLVALLCTVMISSTAAAANWVWIYSDSRFTIYVDNNSIRRDYNYSGYVFRAFIKTVYSEAGRNRRIKWYRTEGQSLPKGIYNLSYDISLHYFKAVDGMKYISALNAVYYTRDGTSIPEMGFSFDSISQWLIINPDSIAETIFDAIYARVPN